MVSHCKSVTTKLHMLCPGAAPGSLLVVIRKHTFDRSTFALNLPTYLRRSVRVPLSLQDGGKRVRFGIGPHPDPDDWRADLHLLYLSPPELCTHCTCGHACESPTYTQLWEQFIDDTGQQEAPKVQLLDQLSAWREWAHGQAEQNHLNARQLELC